MEARVVVAAALNLAGSLFSISAIYVGLIFFHDVKAENVVNVSNIELGIVRQRQTYRARTTVENRSSRLLRILDVRAGCGCTDTNVQDRTIEAYASTDLLCGVQTGRMKGRQSKPITLIWQHEGDERPTHSVVQVDMTVQPDYTIDPLSIEVSRMCPSEHSIAIHFSEPLLNKRVIDASVPNSAFTTRVVNSAADLTTIQVAFDPQQLDVSKPMRSAILIRLEGVAEEAAAVPLVIRDNSPPDSSL